jgi:hypothetical protein
MRSTIMRHWPWLVAGSAVGLAGLAGPLDGTSFSSPGSGILWQIAQP